MRRQRLDHPEAKSCAADTATRQAQGIPIQLVQRTIKGLTTLHFDGGLVFAIAFVGVHANAMTL